MKQSSNICVRSLLVALGFLMSVIFHSSIDAQEVHVSESRIAYEIIVPETILTDTFLVTMSAEWSESQIGLFLLVGDPILDKAGNTPPTGNDIPTGPTYDPTTGPHTRPSFGSQLITQKYPFFGVEQRLM